MLVDIIDRIGTLAALEANWNEVYARDGEAQVFLSFDWIIRWLPRLTIPWVVLGVKTSADAENHVAFMPLQLRVGELANGVLFNTVRMAGTDFAVYTGFICDPRFEEQAIPALAEALKRLNWAYLHFDDFCASRERRQRLTECFAQEEFLVEAKKRAVHVTDDGERIDHNFYLRVNLPADWETYLQAQLKTNTRRDVRAFLRKVEGEGEYRITVADESTFERDLGILLEFWRKQWEGKSRNYARYTIANSRSMLAHLAKNGRVFLPVLWKGDAPIGAHVALIDPVRRSLVCFLVSRDLSIKKPPPGLVLHAYAIRWAIQNGFAHYDLLRGNFSYKYSFGPEERRFESLWIVTKNRRNLHSGLEPRALNLAAKTARKMWTAGKGRQAERASRQILACDPTNVEAHQLLAEIRSVRPVAPSDIKDKYPVNV